jgi:hypothetical protein
MKEMSHVSLASLEIPTQTDASANWSGIRALMLAALEDAIHELGSSVGHRRAAAERWFMSPECQYVFSFAMICETLDLEPSVVRRSLIRLLAKKPPGGRLLERIRRNVRHTEPIRLHASRRRAK